MAYAIKLPWNYYHDKPRGSAWNVQLFRSWGLDEDRYFKEGSDTLSVSSDFVFYRDAGGQYDVIVAVTEAAALWLQVNQPKEAVPFLEQHRIDPTKPPPGHV